METAINLAQSASEEMETVKLYLQRMAESPDEAELYREVIAEELKHTLQFVEAITRLTGIKPEDYEVEEV